MTINLRYRSLDAMPFEKEISSNIEMWHWVETKMNFAMTAYWYVKPGFVSNVKHNIEAVRIPVAIKRTDVIMPIVDENGKIEGESLDVISCDSGKHSIQYGALLSGKIQLWWRNGTVGDKLKTRFVMNESGKYKVSARLTKAPGYAKIQLSLNGKIIAKSINCFNKSDAIVSDIDFGNYSLNEGENTFSIKITASAKSLELENMAGIDYLIFERIR